jgi:WD40 repeat protein
LRAATAGDDKNLVFYHGAPFKFNGIPGRGNHTNFIYSVAFSPNGNHLVSAGADRKIWLYDGKTGEVNGQIGGGEGAHTGSIFGLSWASDSTRLATASADRTVKIFDVETGKATQTFSFGEEGMVSVPHQQVGVVWPGGRTDGLIVSLSLNGDINYMHEGTSKPSRIISGHQKNITTLALSGSGTDTPTLWTGSFEGRLCAWDTARGTAETIDGDGHTNIISGLAAPSSTTGHPRLYSVGWDDTLRSVDVSAKTFAGASTHLSSQPKALACTADSMVIVAQVESVIVYSDGEEIGELPLKSSPTSLAAVGTSVVIGGADSSLRFYAVTPNRAPRQTALIEKVSASPLTAVAFSKDGQLVAAGDSSGKIFVYKLESGSSTPELVTNRWSSAHTAKITSLAWNEAGTHAVSGSLDTNIFVWSLKDPGARVKATNAHKEGVNGVSWLGEKIISCGFDAAVKLWEVSGLK